MALIPFSPLEQFEIVTLIPILPQSLNISFTNSSLVMVIVCAAISLVLMMSTTNSTIIPNRWQSLVELIYEFVMGLIDDNIGAKGQKYFPFVFVLFVFILFANLLGMVPYSFTVTSHIIVTFGLSLSIFIGVVIVGLVHHGVNFFNLFLPSGIPGPLQPVLVAIETLSYLSRALSLAIRLFANMMSGHALMKILAGFAWAMLSAGGVIMLGGVATVALIFAIVGLELGVAMIQAYVFAVLVCLYLNDSINLH